MTWTTPFTAVTGAVITASGWNASARDNLLHLRGLLPDAAGGGLALVSTTATAATFGQVGSSGIADGAIARTAQVNNEVITEPKLDILDSPADNEVLTYDNGTGRFEWQLVGPNSLDAMDSPADDEVVTYNSGNGRLEWQAVSALANSVPSGLVAMFRTAAAIASGWSRETNLDGRMPVGAGTTFGVTYTEATNYGSSWDHAHSITGSITISANTSLGNMNEGGGANHEFASTGHTHGIGGGYGVSTAAWVIPSRAYVFAIKS